MANEKKSNKGAEKSNKDASAEKGASAVYEGKKDAPAMTITQVPIASIEVLAGFNVRQTSEGSPDGEGALGDFPSSTNKNPSNDLHAKGTSLASLASDIKAHGLLQPIIVRPYNGRFAIVSGHRRLAACKLLSLKSIAAVIRDLTEQEAYEINLTENVQREDLSPGEIADRAVFMRQKFTDAYAAGSEGGGDALAKVLGVSKSYMNKLLRYATGLAPEIWKIVRSGKNASAPPNHLLDKWQAMEDHAEQIANYEAWRDSKAAPKKSGTPEGDADGDGKNENDTTPPAVKVEYKRPSKDNLETLEQTIRAFAKEGRIKEDEKRIALNLVLYCIGKLDKKGNPPPCPYVAAKVGEG